MSNLRDSGAQAPTMVLRPTASLKQRGRRHDPGDVSSALANIDALPSAPAGPRSRSAVAPARVSAALLRTQSDARLCRLTSDGYEAAFETLVARYRAPLHRYARRFLADALAEDTVQQAFMDMWAALSADACQEPIRNPRAWLYRVVRNAALNTIRRSSYRDDELEEAVDGDSPEAAFERRSAVREALDGLASLPALQREAIVRCAVEGHSRSEIGVALGLSDGAVGQLLYRARSSLRCVMSALVPLPLITWAAGGRACDAASAARILELSAASTNGAATGILFRGGATLAVIAASATPLIATRTTAAHHEGTSRAAVPIAADSLVSATSEPMQTFPHPLASPARPSVAVSARPAPSAAAPNLAAPAAEASGQAPVEDTSPQAPSAADASPAPEAAPQAEAASPPAPSGEAGPPAEAPPAETTPPAEAPAEEAPPGEAGPVAPVEPGATPE